MNTTKTLALTTLLLTAPTIANADFYDGQRGPTSGQAHYTLSQGAQTTQHNLALKYFGNTGSVSPVGIAALTTDGQQLCYFAGAGVIIEGLNPFSVIPILAYSTDERARVGTAHFVAQATIDLGTFVADPRYHLAVPVHKNTNNPNQNLFGLTLSLGNPKVRIGLDGNYNPKTDKRPLTDVLVRYDLDSQQHTSWLEASIGETGAQLQWRGNF
ncbi:hypothetical protein HYV86_03635 [Candidatus Woesearchaeota archaeon]|nr:hypothetical protein [Candidatus Woesearchaeota archaeon]